MDPTPLVLPYPPTSVATLGIKGRALVALSSWLPCRQEPIPCDRSTSSTSLTLPITSPAFETIPDLKVGQMLHLAVSLGVILSVDMLLKQAFAAAAIIFPSALFGMFCVFFVLMVLDSLAPSAAMGLTNFFEPAALFIQRWLPLFYVPYIVVLPLTAKDVPATSGLKICFILGNYLTKVPSDPGAGDILMGFLGPVIISFAFLMFQQRKLIKRHAAEIFTSVVIAAIFSLYSTAIVGRLLALEPILTVSILPRCITVALALSVVSFFEGANASLTAAAVVFTGLVGANFVQASMDKIGLNDPIARGIATASSAHGLGTAALSAKEPEALPFCAIAYSLTGIVGALLCSIPPVTNSLLLIAG